MEKNGIQQKEGRQKNKVTSKEWCYMQLSIANMNKCFLNRIRAIDINFLNPSKSIPRVYPKKFSLFSNSIKPLIYMEMKREIEPPAY